MGGDCFHFQFSIFPKSRCMLQLPVFPFKNDPVTLRFLIDVPFRLLIFRFFATPLTLLGPPFINFEENDVFHELSILLPFFISTTHVQFSRRNNVLLFIILFVHYDSLFLSLPSLYAHFKPFLKVRPPVYFNPPVY